jgi:hypothetical protein
LVLEDQWWLKYGADDKIILFLAPISKWEMLG